MPRADQLIAADGALLQQRARMGAFGLLGADAFSIADHQQFGIDNFRLSGLAVGQIAFRAITG
ncbi:hypothetical protein EIO60_01575|nr:hypothetical protein [Candidatus Pantoea persica]